MSRQHQREESEFVVGQETTLEQLLWLYSDFFQEQFPLEMRGTLPEERLKELIADCIISQQAYVLGSRFAGIKH